MKYIGTQVTPTYLGPYILKDAIERAGTLKTEEVIKALEETDIKGTIFGRIRFDKYHDLIRGLDG